MTVKSASLMFATVALLTPAVLELNTPTAELPVPVFVPAPTRVRLQRRGRLARTWEGGLTEFEPTYRLRSG